MKRLFFLAVLLGTFVLTGIFAFSYWRLKTRTPQAYFETGKSYYDQGKFSDATIQFMNALKRDGMHRDSRYYLALSYISQQDLGSAIQQLKTLLNGHPDDVEASLRLGNLYLFGGSFNAQYWGEAQKMAQVVLAKEPQNVPALILTGNALAGSKDFAASVEWLEKAIALDPGNPGAWISLGRTRLQQKNVSEAEKAFLKAREVAPEDKSTLISLASFYRVSGSPEKAETVFKDALSQYPADRGIYSQANDFYVRNRRFDDAERVLKAAQAANGNDPTPTLDLADLYKVQGRDKDALNFLLDAKSKFPKSIPLAIKLAGNLIPDKLDLARKEIDQIRAAEPKNPAGDVLLGQLQFASGDFDAAAETLGKEPALGSSFPQVHYLLGNLALRKGKYDEAQDHFQKSIQVNKSYIPAHVSLANGFLVKGDLADARGAVRQLLALDPMNVSGRLMTAMIDSVDKTKSGAEAEFLSLVMEFPDNPEIHRQMGVYWMSRGKNAEAEKSFNRAFELAPNEQSFTELTRVYLSTNQTDRAKQILNTVPDAQKQAFHYELMGMIAEQEDKIQESEIAYRKALEKEPNRLSTESLLFSQYLRTNRLDDAVKEMESLRKRMPSIALVPAMMGAVHEMQGNSKAAEENYTKALETDPTLDLAANNLAYLLVQEERDLQRAQELAEGVRRRLPQSPEAADTLGWIYHKQNLPVLARDQAEFAVSRQPENGVFQYHLGEIYKKSSQNSKAVAALKKAVASSSPKTFKERELADAALKDLQKGPTTGRR